MPSKQPQNPKMPPRITMASYSTAHVDIRRELLDVFYRAGVDHSLQSQAFDDFPGPLNDEERTVVWEIMEELKSVWPTGVPRPNVIDLIRWSEEQALFKRERGFFASKKKEAEREEEQTEEDMKVDKSKDKARIDTSAQEEQDHDILKSLGEEKYADDLARTVAESLKDRQHQDSSSSSGSQSNSPSGSDLDSTHATEDSQSVRSSLTVEERDFLVAQDAAIVCALHDSLNSQSYQRNPTSAAAWVQDMLELQRGDEPDTGEASGSKTPIGVHCQAAVYTLTDLLDHQVSLSTIHGGQSPGSPATEEPQHPQVAQDEGINTKFSQPPHANQEEQNDDIIHDTQASTTRTARDGRKW
jgi:hypothetical protein